MNDLKMPLLAEFAVASALGGVPTSHVLRLVRNVTHRKFMHTSGVHAILTGVLSALGFEAQPDFDCRAQPIPFGLFILSHQEQLQATPVIVHLASHVLVIENEHFVDHQHLEPTPIADAPTGWQVTTFRAVRRSLRSDQGHQA